MIDIEKLNEMWEKDSRIDPAQLDNTSIDVASLHAKYLRLFSSCKLLLKKKEANFAELRLLKWRYYTGKMTKDEMDKYSYDYDPFHGSTKPMKNELQQYIDSDKEVAKAKLKIEYIKIVIDTLEEIIGTLRWRHTVIKNIIDFRKFQAGI